LSEADPQPFDPLDYETIAATVVDALLHRPLEALAALPQFRGAGIYALYYGGDFPAYASIRLPEVQVPIYVGKAVPPGTRKGADALHPQVGQALCRRLKEHASSIEQATNLELVDFQCRYLCVQHLWIPLAEQVLVSKFQPVWNVVLDGFGNHPPGSGRRGMRRPRWDILHPGRPWALALEAQETAEQMDKLVREQLAGTAGPSPSPFGQDDG